jgi:hypothetical protein
MIRSPPRAPARGAAPAPRAAAPLGRCGTQYRPPSGLAATAGYPFVLTRYISYDALTGDTHAEFKSLIGRAILP